MAATSIRLKSSDLIRVCNLLKHLIPSGSATMPIGLYLRNNVLSIYCTQRCRFKADLALIDKVEAEYAVTVLYTDIKGLLTSGESVTLTFEAYGVELESSSFTCMMTLGYSTVEPFEEPDIVFSDITSQDYLIGLRNISTAYSGLINIYKHETLIDCYGNACVLALPNVIIKARTSAFGVTGRIAIDYIKLIAALCPTQYTICGNKLWFSSNGIYINVPLSNQVNDDLTSQLISSMSEPHTVNLEHYSDKLRMLTTINKNAHCTITLYENGMATSASVENITTSVKTGKCDNVVKVVSLPLRLWTFLLKLADSETAQYLVGKDTICLRTKDIVIVTRALL